jgi:hypothetical protein
VHQPGRGSSPGAGRLAESPSSRVNSPGRQLATSLPGLFDCGIAALCNFRAVVEGMHVRYDPLGAGPCRTLGQTPYRRSNLPGRSPDTARSSFTLLARPRVAGWNSTLCNSYAVAEWMAVRSESPVATIAGRSYWSPFPKRVRCPDLDRSRRLHHGHERRLSRCPVRGPGPPTGRYGCPALFQSNRIPA